MFAVCHRNSNGRLSRYDVNDCYPHNALHIVVYAVVQCPFVCLSVRLSPLLSQNG